MNWKKIVLLIFILVVITGGFVVYYLFFQNTRANLEVNSDPVSEVYIDSKDVGKTPYTTTYEAKRVKVSLGDFETEVDLQAGIKTIINKTVDGSQIFYFEKTGLKEAQSLVISDPSQLVVKIDGNEFGSTPISVDSLNEGQHDLEIGNEAFKINLYKGYKLIAAVDLPKTAQVQALPQLQELEKTYVEILSTPNGFLRVRKEATTASSEVARIHPGEKYELITTDKKAGWLNIRLNATESGWISDTYAAKVN